MTAVAAVPLAKKKTNTRINTPDLWKLVYAVTELRTVQAPEGLVHKIGLENEIVHGTEIAIGTNKKTKHARITRPASIQ